MRILKLFVVLTIVLSGLASARAQRQIVLGNSAVPLDGLWKFHIGDVLHVPISFFPFGIGITVSQCGTILSLLIITVLRRRRFLRSQREREQFRQEKSAAEIAAAAQGFGQEDDITVVQIARVGVAVLVAG